MKTAEAIEKLSHVDKSLKLRNILLGLNAGDLLEFLLHRKETHGENSFVYDDVEQEVERLFTNELAKEYIK